jgi:error-prone DNA polymerase
VPEGYAGVGVQQDAGQTGNSPAPVRSRVLVHSSGFQMSPYADVKPAGESVKDVARKLWHRSPGSPG